MRKITRTDKSTGNQEIVTMDFAIDKLIKANNDCQSDYSSYKSTLLAGVKMQTAFFYYELALTLRKGGKNVTNE